MIDQSYFVTSGKALLLPVKKSDDEVATFEFPALSFTGELDSYATVRAQTLVRERAVRALCLAFNNVTLLPYMDKIPTRQQLYVPVFAVAAITRRLTQ